MSSASMQPASSPSHMQRHEKSHPLGQVNVAKESSQRPRLSTSATDRPVTSSNSRQDRKEPAGSELDEGYDSDATLDLDEQLSSPMLRDTLPLKRMSTNYEQVVLLSLTRRKGVAYACACSLDANTAPGGGRKSAVADWVIDNGDLSNDESESDFDSWSGEDNEESQSLSDCSSQSDEEHMRFEKYSSNKKD